MRERAWPERLLAAATLAAVGAAIYMALLYAPTERTMGDAQRIFYFHLPLAWIGFLAFLVVFAAGIGYLATRAPGWDLLAASSAEVGVVFSSLVLVTGSIWARQAWNTWWTWEPRLTTMLVLWLIYAGYLMVRAAVEEEEKRARFSAVIGTVGFVNVPLVFMSIRWWRSMHPIVLTRSGMAIEPRMLAALLVGLAAFTLLYAWLLVRRLQIARAERALRALASRRDALVEEEA